MQIIGNQIYHIYNQGNNKQKIFYKRENYHYFLSKFKKYVVPKAEVLAYCLMPNHFHFMVNTTKDSVQNEKVGSLMVNALSNGFRKLLSTYAQAINKQENRSGSLFRQKTKAKLVVSIHLLSLYPPKSVTCRTGSKNGRLGIFLVS